MGFSSALQGPASHDAILLRIDAELRLLENMRRCVGIRIKSDSKFLQHPGRLSIGNFGKNIEKIKYQQTLLYFQMILGEYAISLNSFVLQAQKMDSVELCGSHVAKGKLPNCLLFLISGYN